MNRNGKQSEDCFGKKKLRKTEEKGRRGCAENTQWEDEPAPTGALAPDVHYLKRPFLHSKTSVEMVFRLYLRKDSIFQIRSCQVIS